MAMRLQGYRIVRVNNVEVYENLDGVLETIFAALERCETWLTLAPREGGEGRVRGPAIAMRASRRSPHPAFGHLLPARAGRREAACVSAPVIAGFVAASRPDPGAGHDAERTAALHLNLLTEASTAAVRSRLIPDLARR
jgi:hypothetical protein